MLIRLSWRHESVMIFESVIKNFEKAIDLQVWTLLKEWTLLQKSEKHICFTRLNKACEQAISIKSYGWWQTNRWLFSVLHSFTWGKMTLHGDILLNTDSMKRHTHFNLTPEESVNAIWNGCSYLSVWDGKYTLKTEERANQVRFSITKKKKKKKAAPKKRFRWNRKKWLAWLDPGTYTFGESTRFVIATIWCF